MKQGMRSRGGRIVRKVAPGVAQSVDHLRSLPESVRDLRRQVKKMRGRLDELEEEVQEARRLNRRLAELTDIVQELLVPAAGRDEERLRELLDKYAERF